MASFLLFIGYATWLVVLVAIVAASVAFVLNGVEHVVLKIEKKAENEERQRIANDIITNSWWFSESPEALISVKLIGQRLMNGPTICISTVREEWRKEVSASKEKENK